MTTSVKESRRAAASWIMGAAKTLFGWTGVFAESADVPGASTANKILKSDYFRNYIKDKALAESRKTYGTAATNRAIAEQYGSLEKYRKTPILKEVKGIPKLLIKGVGEIAKKPDIIKNIIGDVKNLKQLKMDKKLPPPKSNFAIGLPPSTKGPGSVIDLDSLTTVEKFREKEKLPNKLGIKPGAVQTELGEFYLPNYKADFAQRNDNVFIPDEEIEELIRKSSEPIEKYGLQGKELINFEKTIHEFENEINNEKKQMVENLYTIDKSIIDKLPTMKDYMKFITNDKTLETLNTKKTQKILKKKARKILISARKKESPEDEKTIYNVLMTIGKHLNKIKPLEQAKKKMMNLLKNAVSGKNDIIKDTLLLGSKFIESTIHKPKIINDIFNLDRQSKTTGKEINEYIPKKKIEHNGITPIELINLTKEDGPGSIVKYRKAPEYNQIPSAIVNTDPSKLHRQNMKMLNKERAFNYGDLTGILDIDEPIIPGINTGWFKGGAAPATKKRRKKQKCPKGYKFSKKKQKCVKIKKRKKSRRKK
ncbi:MAG: hypothetical protein KAT68_11790 [Bacteroidales bacterium]|nr:hypothetical protein [Bacteroidales bacterium]